MLQYKKEVIFVIIIIIFCQDGFAQTEKDSTSLSSNANKLEFNLEIPIWVPGFRGRFSIGDVTIEGEGQNDDLLSQYFNSDVGLDFYFVGKVGVTKNKWQLQSDVFGGQLSDAIEFTYNQTQIVDVEIFTIFPRVFLSYKLFEKDFKRKRARLTKHVEFWGYTGCRYFHLDITTKFNTSLPEYNITKDWFDPIIGFSVPLKISRFTLVFQNDIGGFGLGSDWTYWYQLNGQYQLGQHFSIGAGWTHLNINYSEEKRNDSFSYKAILRGPMVGIMLTF